MSRSIKPKNNNYWDSTGIVHNREKLNSLLSKFIKMGNVLPTGISFDDLMITGESSCYTISKDYGNTVLPGFPTGAYGYGTLITINPQQRTNNAYSTFQIYLTDGIQYGDSNGAYGVFIRSRVAGTWIRISGVDVEPIT